MVAIRLERIQGFFAGEVHVADVRALAPADAEADGRERRAFAANIVQAHAADKIETAFDAGIALEEFLDGVEPFSSNVRNTLEVIITSILA